MVYAATSSELQRVMRWKLTLQDFGPNIQHISGVDNIVSHTITIFMSTTVDQDETRTSKALSQVEKIICKQIITNRQ